MTDDGQALEAEKRGAAVFGVVHGAGELRKTALGQKPAHHAHDTGFENALDHVRDGLGEAFAHLDHDVSDEAVADDHVHVASEDIASLGVADEVQVPGHLEKLIGFLHLAVAFAFLLADGQDAHAR